MENYFRNFGIVPTLIYLSVKQSLKYSFLHLRREDRFSSSEIKYLQKKMVRFIWIPDLFPSIFVFRKVDTA